jgi:hypothetical protein
VTDTPFDVQRTKLWNEIVSVKDLWAQYRYLFIDSHQRIEMLMACANWYFGVTQRLMLQGVILGLSRLTDPVSQGKHANLVVASLLDDPRVDVIPGLRAELSAEIAEVAARVEPIRTHRDKYIAHLDRATVVKENLLPPLARDAISDVIGRLGRIYQLHSLRVRETDSTLDLYAMGSAQALVKILEESERWKIMKELKQDGGQE